MTGRGPSTCNFEIYKVYAGSKPSQNDDERVKKYLRTDRGRDRRCASRAFATRCSEQTAARCYPRGPIILSLTGDGISNTTRITGKTKWPSHCLRIDSGPQIYNAEERSSNHASLCPTTPVSERGHRQDQTAKAHDAP